MARMARVVVPGIPHHVTQRGNRRQNTFFCDSDYRRYIALLSNASKRARTEIWAYCLMPNHVHFVMVPSTSDGLRDTFAEAHRRYTTYINKREGWQGHLWQERFHSYAMDDRHLMAAVRYIERNPVAASLCQHAQDWPWSSARAHIRGRSNQLVNVEPMKKLVDDWHQYLDVEVDVSERQEISMHSSTGRPLGDKTFIENVEALTGRELIRKKPGRKAVNS